RFVTRFRAGTRARQAQSRAKKLEKTRRIEAAPRAGKSLGFSFAAPQRSGRVVLELEKAAFRAGEKELVRDAVMWLDCGEPVSITRAPLDAGISRTVSLEDRSLRYYDGSVAEYVSVREERKKATPPTKARPKTKSRNGKPPAAGPSKNRKKLIASIERQIEAA